MSDWETVVAVSRAELTRLEQRAMRFGRARRRWRLATLVLAGVVAGLAPTLWLAWRHAGTLASDVAEYKTTLDRSQAALSALSTSHEKLLEATAHAPSVGTASWGRRFEVTKYVPRTERRCSGACGHGSCVVRSA